MKQSHTGLMGRYNLPHKLQFIQAWCHLQFNEGKDS